MKLARMLAGFLLVCAPGAAAREPPTVPGTTPLRLADLQAEAERKHPAIQAAARRADAKRLRVRPAQAFPDPSVSVGWMGNITPFDVQNGDPSSFRSVNAMQELPFPGKRQLRGEVAAKEADAEQWNVEAAQRRVRAEVAVAFAACGPMRCWVPLSMTTRRGQGIPGAHSSPCGLVRRRLLVRDDRGMAAFRLTTAIGVPSTLSGAAPQK